MAETPPPGTQDRQSFDPRDPAGLGATLELECELAEVAGVLNAQHARLVEIVERALDHDHWVGFGVHSPAQWLAIHTGLSPARARSLVELAGRRSSFPCVAEAFGRGELAVDQVVEAVKVPPSADAAISGLAAACTVTQLRKVVRGYCFDNASEPSGDAVSDDAVPDDAASTPEPVDRLSFRQDAEGRFHLHGEFGPDVGAVVEAALAEARDALFRDGRPDVTWAEAFEEMAQRSLDNVALPTRRDRFKVYIHLDEGSAQSGSGQRLPEAIRRAITCDTTGQIVWGRHGVPVSVGRSQRIVPARTRRLVLRRDQGCRVPGCDHDRYIEVHHIVHWEDGGPTDTANLVGLCPHHHRLHHRGGLRISGDADATDGMIFADSHGRPIADRARPQPPDETRPAPPGVFIHPTGERLNTKWISLS